MYPDYVEALLLPDTYTHKVDKVQFEQTHLSYVFIAGKYVYKIKKSVSFDFVDQTKLSQRYEFCVAEVEQNRVLAPDVYLGVVSINKNPDGRIFISEDGQKDDIIEYAVKMKKLQIQDNLEFLINQKTAIENFAEIVVNKIFSFHQKAKPFNAGLEQGGWQAEQAWCNDELLQQKIHIGHSLEKSNAQLINEYMMKTLEKFKLVFDTRYTDGQIVFGHGDLQLKHFYLDRSKKDELSIVDCIEFSNDFHFKYIDKGYDLSFLTMGLDLYSHSFLADEISGKYLSLAGDKYLGLLHPYHKFLRALIRGKVEGLTALSDTADEQTKKIFFDSSKNFFKLATKYAKTIQTPFVTVVAGLSGTGKSMIAGAIACRVGAIYLSSDVIRKEMFGISKYDHISASDAKNIYSETSHIAVYAEIRRQARKYIASGFSVVIDAAHLKIEERQAIRKLCFELSMPLEFIWLNADSHIVKERINKRKKMQYIISDADLEIHNLQLDSYEKITKKEIVSIVTNSSSFESVFRELTNSSELLHDRLLF